MAKKEEEKKKERERLFLHGEINFEVIPSLAVLEEKISNQPMRHYRQTKPEVKSGQNILRMYIYYIYHIKSSQSNRILLKAWKNCLHR